MSRWLRLTRLAALATVLSATPALSDVLDQSQPTPIGGMWRKAALHGAGITGATFTAGIAGRLSRLEVGLARVGDPGAMTLTIYSTDAGGLPVTPLGSVTVSSSPVRAWQDDDQFPLHEINVEAMNLTLAPGTRYAYALTSAVQGETDYVMVAGTEEDVYTQGGYYVTGSQGVYIYPQHDGVFRTWVDAAVPVQPGTWGRVKALYR